VLRSAKLQGAQNNTVTIQSCLSHRQTREVLREALDSSEILFCRQKFVVNEQNQVIYRIEDFEIDPSRFRLSRDGENRHLRQKTFQVLIYLLEHRERLVTKEELFEQIWVDTAVSDNALDQCLAEIRKAFGDDSRHPRFVKTIPRAGYRFIGPLTSESSMADAAKSAEADSQITSPFAPAPAPALAEEPKLISRWGRLRALRFAWLLIGALVIVGLVGGVYLIRSRSAEQLGTFTLRQEPGKRPVAVMFFDNQSNSEELDWLREGLADMLITDLSRSKNLAVLSRQQLQLMLERTGRADNRNIRLDEALDLARKSQAKVVILGSFVQLGQQIRVDVRLHDVRDGELLAAERLIVEQPTQILTQIDLLSLKLASHLGAVASDREDSGGLITEMTKNLEAYRNYSLGVEKAHAYHSSEAIELFRKAISLDPDFAMAHARIGYTLAVAGNNVDEGKPYLERAFQLSRRLTRKDELNIAAWYAIANKDYENAIKTFREIVTHYPLDVEPYQRLGHLLRGEGQTDEAIEILKQGLVIDSGAKDLYNSLGVTYMELNRADEAIAMFQRYVQLAPKEPNAYDSLGTGFAQTGRYQEAIAEFFRALELKSDFEIAVVHLGNVYLQQGRYREALEQYRRYLSIVSFSVERGRGLNCVAFVQRIAGKRDDAERTIKQSLREDPNNLSEAIMLALQSREIEKAAKLVDSYRELFEREQFSNRGQKAVLRIPYFYLGQVQLKTGRSAEAVDTFQTVLKHRLPFWHYDTFEDCLANAYLELGRFDEAIAEYERVLRLNPNYPLVHYRLAQAYEGKGDAGRARSFYEQFLQVWRQADRDVPEVVIATSKTK
jgi:tetratricopeptide (TPR) repeat protein